MEKAANFTPEHIPRLQALLKFALAEDKPEFYRRKYSGLRTTITSYQDLAGLPPLDKSEISGTDWRELLFIEESKVDHFAFSSGTTGRPMIVPRLAEDGRSGTVASTLDPELLGELGVRRIMLFISPFSPIAALAASLSVPGLRYIPGDIRNPELTARLASQLAVDGFHTTPTGLVLLLQAYKKLGLDTGGIKWVSLGAEGTSKAKYAYFRDKLPRAHFNFRLASAELGSGRFFRCRHLEGDPSIFHIVPGSHILEILREDGTLCGFGETGEMVHTDLLLPKAFPYLRYRTGDDSSLERCVCPCGSPWLLRLDGRRGFNRLKLAGVTITEEIVEAALARAADFVKMDFRLRASEELSGESPLPALELTLIPLKTAAPFLAENLARILEDAMSLTPTRTLGDLVKEGAFAPLSVKFTDAFPPGDGKPRKIFSKPD